jgi:tetratricopeptide (TPR) repeat protein
MRIFLSYHSPDRARAERLAAGIEKARPGASVFFDQKRILAGAWWQATLAEEIEKADAVVFLLGDATGPWQELEYHHARDLNVKSRGARPRLVPVVTGRQAPGLPFLSQLHLIFGPDVDRALDAVLAALDQAPAGAGDPAWRLMNPYKGLPALTAGDGAFFFGREAQTADLLDRLAAAPESLIALVGASGVGKSSLAQAGLLGALRSQLWPKAPGVAAASAWPTSLADSRGWLSIVVRPGEDPIGALARSLVRLYRERSFEVDEEAEGWVKRFAAGRTLGDLVRVAREEIAVRAGVDPPSAILLYVDQGEELFTQTKREEADLFGRLVAEAVGRRDCRVALSLRADHYASFQATGALFERSARIDIPPLGRQGLLDVIERPAALLGARFEEPSIPARIADAAAKEPGALPLLSDLMAGMWAHMQARARDPVLTWSDSGAIDVARPLRERAEAFLAAHPTDAERLKRLFKLRLTYLPPAGDAVRRRVRRSEADPADWDLVSELALPEVRLLMITDAGGEPVAEVAHEQLLRTWPRLAAWLEEERAFLIWKGETERDAEQWAAAPEADRDGALLMGRALSMARTWFETRADDLDGRERRFVEASIARHDKLEAEAAERERRLREAELDRERLAREKAEEKAGAARRWNVLAGAAAVVLLIAAAGAGFFAYDANRQRGVADRERREASTQRDAARAAQSVAEEQRAQADAQRQEAETERLRAQVQARIAQQALEMAQVANQGELQALERMRAALEQAEQALGRMREAQTVATAERDAAQRNFALARDTIGDVIRQFAQGFKSVEGVRSAVVEQVLERTRRALAVLERAAPEDRAVQHLRAVLLAEFGDVYAGAGDFLRAPPAYQESVDALRRLVAADPQNARWRADMARALARSGATLKQTGDRRAALAAYEEALGHQRALAEAVPFPQNLSYQRDAIASLNAIGELKREERDAPGARAAHDEALALARRLAREQPRVTALQGDVAEALEGVAVTKASGGDVAGALRDLGEALTLRRRLVAADRGNIEQQRGLAFLLLRTGDLRRAAGDAQAVETLSEALALLRRLADLDPERLQGQLDVCTALWRLAEAGSEPRQRFADIVAILRPLAGAGRLPATWREQLLPLAERRLADLARN